MLKFIHQNPEVTTRFEMKILISEHTKGITKSFKKFNYKMIQFLLQGSEKVYQGQSGSTNGVGVTKHTQASCSSDRNL